MADTDDKGSAPATGAAPDDATSKPPATGEGAPATGGTASTTTPEPDLTPEEIRDLRESNRRMEEALKKANKEAETSRREKKAAEDAKLTAEEQKEQELRELRESAETSRVELAELRLEQAVNRLSGKLGIIDAETVTRLLDWDDLEFDDAGIAQNVETVVKELLVRKPFLAGKAAPAPAQRTGNNAADGTGGTPGPSLTADELTVAQSTGMDPSRYAQLKSVKTLDDYIKTRPKPS